VSRRAFWAEIHRLASGGTTILLTTHYMDEAERCHRLAFIFRGHVLDEGRPDDVIARRALIAAEVDLPEEAAGATEIAAALRARPEVDEVEHYGHTLRVIAHAGADPVALLAEVAPGAAPRPARLPGGDAFVSWVRGGEAGSGPASASAASSWSRARSSSSCAAIASPSA